MHLLRLPPGGISTLFLVPAEFSWALKHDIVHWLRRATSETYASGPETSYQPST